MAATKSLEEVHGSVPVKYGSFLRRLFAFAGPAYIVSVGYMDPGNWATDLEGGSRFGYELLWVLLMSNLIALLLQTLSARMGIVAGRDLAQACRERFGRVPSFFLWILSEVAIAACDLAEIIGTIIGLHLLFGISFELGVILTAFDTLLLLAIQRLGIRKMETFIIVLVATVGLCFLLEIILANPDWAAVAGGLIPSLHATAPFVFPNTEALYIAIGIIGATVMPHNLYLHSALVQSRQIERTKEGIKQACKFNLIDSAVALNAAFFVNAAILILAASAFFAHGQVVSDLTEAHSLLPQFLGASAASTLFAIALLASGQSSTLTGTLAGQIVMEGFINFKLQPWVRRLLTRLIALAPAAATIYIFGSEQLTDLLILSQVVLSLQLPFAIIPLIQVTSDRRVMGEFANRLWVKSLAWVAASIIIALNISLVVSQVGEWIALAAEKGFSPLWVQLTAIPLALGCGALLVYLLAHDFIRSKQADKTAALAETEFETLAGPSYGRIGVAVEHGPNDRVALRHACALAQQHGAELVIVHVVDGVGGQWHGAESADRESTADAAYLDRIVTELAKKNIPATAALRFGSPAQQIIAAIREHRIELIVMRAHGHGFWKDRLFGQTIDAVRHGTPIPVLAVRE